ncbi:hypothetical protein E4U30_008139 [Claviceps sp. LM220 group G6]|nr:hypothetical protein E4U15_000024 [Claviceps sp. LM218 group G6]KAG6102162.1 hypothetical protein E4U30_008139 [Claviceps sp. LM220 group G6]KAG6107665.1 hypothetical protein E4U31_008221 [Claviceps sp. LM219 group G6]KAG6113724.1 hypothetical protein E4U14_001644 [Claviceps sp. LM454 group G7]
MAGPTSPSYEGPSFGPPSLPSGWIAQWDGASRKYYYVQIATGAAQWETPTQAAKTGGTPGQAVEHPYGTPPPQLITHPDGSQTVKHPDGTMEPILTDGARGVDGPTGDRGIGSMAMNAILGGKKQSSGGGGIGGLASQFLGGSSGGSGHGGGGGGSGGGNGIAGQLAGKLVSNLFSSSDKPDTPQNYHGGHGGSKPSQQGGLAGTVFGGVAHMFGGKDSHGSGNQNFGYSNVGAGTYAGGEAPTYNPPGGTHSASSAAPHSSSHTPSSATNQSHQQHSSSSHHSQAHQSYPPPPPQGHNPNQHSGSTYQGGYQGYEQNPPSYGGQNYGGAHHGAQGGYPGGVSPNYGAPPQQHQSYGHTQHGGHSSYQQGHSSHSYNGQQYGGGRY